MPDGGPSGNERVLTVNEYTVQYAEGVENELISFVDLSALGLDTSTQASGVIVSSEERHIWWEERSASQLAHSGSETIYLGGLGQRESVTVTRMGWTPIGNASVYQVYLSHGDRRVLGYESSARRVHGTFAGRNLSIESDEGTFQVLIESPTDRTSVPIPSTNESVTSGPLTLERSESSLYGVIGETRVRIATQALN
ncbi:MAG: hypothetical protein U5K37_05515 [Natrialbaceae archaeon]|nr:hypothetical protein [Natrialbaceae archaeon]